MEQQTEIESNVPLTKGDNEIPPLNIGEMGYNGLMVLGGEILEECSWELRWPDCINTFKKMAKDAVIAPALDLNETMVARVPWSVKVPEGYEDELKDKANFLRQVMNDMDHDWLSFIKQCTSFNRYGFAVHEKVYRVRRKENGSKFNDGLIGIKKLPIRAQDTILGWEWKNTGRDLSGLWQLYNRPQGMRLTASNIGDIPLENKKFIPRKKFLLFRHNPLKDSPVGTSVLVSAWQSWKYRQAFLESEAMGVAADAHGFKLLYLPPQYLSEDATEADKKVYSEYKKVMAGLHDVSKSGLILPLITDENGKRLFEFEVKNLNGNKAYDTNAIIQRYSAEILTALFADFLTLGRSGGGSFSLAESKLDIVQMVIEGKLNEIKSQLNHDLIPQLFELNGWDTDVTPYFDYGEVGKESLDEVSKFIQRSRAVGALPVNRDVVNWVLGQANIPYRVPENTTDEELDAMLGKATTRSGEGMASDTGGLNGTGDSVPEDDTSISNQENT